LGGIEDGFMSGTQFNEKCQSSVGGVPAGKTSAVAHKGCA
jgi:hypothetical protein